MTASADKQTRSDQVQDASALRVVAWETTRRCPLACKHCRGAARDTPYTGELTTREGFRLIESIASFSKPILILTGGEPMVRGDIYELARYATDLGLRVAMAPCGPMITAEAVKEMRASGIRRISVSLDGATHEQHDAFRCVKGAFGSALKGIAFAKNGGLDFQINTTVSRMNVETLPAIRDLAFELGAKVWDLFFLVPMGRGSSLKTLALDSVETERILRWVLHEGSRGEMTVKTTCAPQIARIRQAVTSDARPPFGGCIGGRGFCFISHVGRVQPCGFLDIECGNLRESGFDFQSIYADASVFRKLRNLDHYKGTCGACRFLATCGGCRARALSLNGDYLEGDPSCLYAPQ